MVTAAVVVVVLVVGGMLQGALIVTQPVGGHRPGVQSQFTTAAQVPPKDTATPSTHLTKQPPVQGPGAVVVVGGSERQQPQTSPQVPESCGQEQAPLTVEEHVLVDRTGTPFSSNSVQHSPQRHCCPGDVVVVVAQSHAVVVVVVVVPAAVVVVVVVHTGAEFVATLQFVTAISEPDSPQHGGFKHTHSPVVVVVVVVLVVVVEASGQLQSDVVVVVVVVVPPVVVVVVVDVVVVVVDVAHVLEYSTYTLLIMSQ